VRIPAAADARAGVVRSSHAQRLAELLLDAGQHGTVVFTGAGVSTESGIPDFRGPGGIWTRYAPIDFKDYVRDAELRRESWRRGLHTYADMADAQPNPAHLAIADWFQIGLVSGVVTQNIDGLHQKAGLPASAVMELHGNAHSVGCLSCDARFDRLAIHERVLAGDEDPACTGCGGMLKTTTISFGQAMPEREVAAAERLHAAARLCVVIGSSLVVYPAAMLPEITLDAGGRLAIVNESETHLDHRATLVARARAGELLAAVHIPSTH
jgi:NAD-dependent deacetylase